MRIARTTYPAGTWIGRAWSNPVSLSVSVSLVYLLVFALGFAALFAPQRLVLRLSVSASGQQSVEWILPGGRLWESGVRSGDRIVSLDGAAPKAEHNGYWAGTSAVINTKEGPISVVAPTDGRIARRTWPLLALSPWFFLLGTQILLRATNRRTGRAAYALFTSTALELALAPSSERYIPLAVAAEFVMLPVFAYCFVRFFVLYPVEHSSRLISYALLLPAALLALLGPAGLVWPELYDAGSLLRLLILFGYVSLATVLLTWSYITTRGSAVGSGLAVIGISTLASVLPFVLLYLLPEVLNRQPIVAPERAILALGILPVGFGYAIVRHKAMNVPLIQRWIVHGLILAMLLIAYASAAYVLLQPPLRPVTSPCSPSLRASRSDGSTSN